MQQVRDHRVLQAQRRHRQGGECGPGAAVGDDADIALAVMGQRPGGSRGGAIATRMVRPKSSSRATRSPARASSPPKRWTTPVTRRGGSHPHRRSPPRACSARTRRRGGRGPLRRPRGRAGGPPVPAPGAGIGQPHARREAACNLQIPTQPRHQQDADDLQNVDLTGNNGISLPGNIARRSLIPDVARVRDQGVADSRMS